MELLINKRYSIIRIYAIMLILVSCKSAERMSIDRQEYNSNLFRIDGYYFTKVDNKTYPIMFFKNGMTLNFGEIQSTDLNYVDSLIRDPAFIRRVINTQYGWGLFYVKHNKLVIEEWLPGAGGPYPTHILKGDIINDTTLELEGIYDNSYKVKRHRLYFQEFSPKPDSTNRFLD